jgi:hypothetical protein
MRARSLLLPILPIVLGVPALAGAQSSPAPPTSVAAIEDRTAHRHDGFYLRLATGFGSQHQTIRLEGHEPGVTVSGVSSVGELAFGYAFRPGRIFGLGFYSSTLVVTSRTFHIDQPMPPAEILNDVKDVNVCGPFYDHYFDARGGMHVQGAMGVATVRGLGVPDARVDDHLVVGVGFVLGFGYDWWISDQWALGVLGRVAIASTTADDQDGVRWEHGVSAMPSLLFTATYN